MKLIFFLFAVCLGGAFNVAGQEPDWLVKLRKLKVLESTKADVERVFNSPKIIDASDSAEKEKNGEEYISYKTKDGILEVDYSTGTCAELNSSFGYDIVSGTITEMNFEPKKPVKASLLNFDYDSFTESPVSDVPGLTTYIKIEDGIWITIYNGDVTRIKFSPSAKYDYLECGRIKK